ncbi:MAG TPA: polyhydroxyalkanoate synthesis repressor PhaR [Alphaproteobacteria bacterium]
MAGRREGPSIIKKYANRRLYHTEISQYITLEDVADMVRQGEDLKVVDARTNEDLTRTVLTQIIVEQEAKGENLLPIKFLREIIRMYSNNMRPILPHYLDHAMDNLLNNQEKVSKYWTEQLGAAQKTIPLLPNQAMEKMNATIEDIARQNVQLFESAMKVFSPFIVMAPADKKQKVDSLKQQARAIQRRIDELEKLGD